MRKIAFLSLFISLLNSSCMKKATCTCNHHDGTLNHQLKESSLWKKDVNTWKDKCRNTTTVDRVYVPTSNGPDSSISYTTACVVN